MSSQLDSNSFNYQYQNDNYNNNSNKNYDKSNNNYPFQNNNDYIYDPYNNKYGYIIKYHNNYPVYSYIPPSFPPQNKNNNQTTNLHITEKTSQNIFNNLFLHLVDIKDDSFINTFNSLLILFILSDIYYHLQ